MMQSQIIDLTTNKRSSQIVLRSVVVGKQERDLMESQDTVYLYDIIINTRCDLKIKIWTEK